MIENEFYIEKIINYKENNYKIDYMKLINGDWLSKNNIKENGKVQIGRRYLREIKLRDHM